MATSLDRAVLGFLDHLAVERGASAHTLAAYRRDLARYAEYLDAANIDDLADVTQALAAGFATHLGAGDRPLAATSVARAIVAVRSLHKFALTDGVVEVNVTEEISPPKIGMRLPKALSLDQVTLLLDAPDRTTPLGLRDSALLEMLYGTGARISELMDLDVDDISGLRPERAVLRLYGKGRKERIVPVGSFAKSAVEAWLVRGRPSLKPKCPALFLNQLGRRLSRQSAWAILRQNADKAGLDVEVSPHTLRHSFATHLLDGGADVRVVQELLGHASVTTTQIYTMVTAEHLREVFLEAHPRAR